MACIDRSMAYILPDTIGFAVYSGLMLASLSRGWHGEWKICLLRVDMDSYIYLVIYVDICGMYTMRDADFDTDTDTDTLIPGQSNCFPMICCATAEV